MFTKQPGLLVLGVRPQVRLHPLFLVLDAVVVGAPVDDVLFDCVGFEALGEGFVDQGWEFGVGGET